MSRIGNFVICIELAPGLLSLTKTIFCFIANWNKDEVIYKY